MTSSSFRRLLGGVLLGAATAAASGCDVEAYPAAYPDDGGDYPPAAFIATAEPVYYEGHASYWYGNHWVYRDGNRWGSYRREPPALAQRRAEHGEPPRTNYARPSVRRAAPQQRGGRR
jgi:hypothetical protein